MTVEEVRDHLTSTYGIDGERLGLIWIGGPCDGWRGACFNDVAAAATYAAGLDAKGGQGVYHRGTTLRNAPSHGRAEADAPGWAHSFGLDLDLRGPGHKKSNLPNTREQLDDALDAAKLPAASRWTFSGGGWYAWWQFPEPVPVTSEVAQAFKKLSDHILNVAKAEFGWKFDAVHDLSRVWRQPGTTNRKIDGAPTHCVAHADTGNRYTLPQLLACAEDVATHVPAAREGTSGNDVFTDPSSPWTRDAALREANKWLDVLRAAGPDDAVNKTLNDVAMRLGHFVPGLASEEQTRVALRATLDENTWHTDATAGWSADATITSGLKAGMREPYKVAAADSATSLTNTVSSTAEPIAPAWADPFTPDFDKLVEQIRRKVATDAARKAVEAREWSKAWQPPEDFGTLADELSRPVDPIVWRVDGLLPARGNMIIIATRKAGKTTFAGSLIKALADGGDFLGRLGVRRAESIALFNYENTRAQQTDWLRSLGVANTEAVHVRHLRGLPMPLNVAAVRAEIVAWLKARRVEVWIIDPYLMAARGVVTNENDNAEAVAFTSILDEMKLEAGVAEIVMPVHASPKGDVEVGRESMRGASRVEDWADGVAFLTRDDRGTRYLRSVGRDVEMDQTKMHWNATTRELTLGHPGSSAAQGKRDYDAELVIKALATWDELTPPSQNGLALRLGWRDRRKIGEVVAALIAAGRVRTEKGPGTAIYHFLGSNDSKQETLNQSYGAGDLNEETSDEEETGESDYFTDPS